MTLKSGNKVMTGWDVRTCCIDRVSATWTGMDVVGGKARMVAAADYPQASEEGRVRTLLPSTPDTRRPAARVAFLLRHLSCLTTDHVVRRLRHQERHPSRGTISVIRDRLESKFTSKENRQNGKRAKEEVAAENYFLK